jgi:hypothetical protein
MRLNYTSIRVFSYYILIFILSHYQWLRHHPGEVAVLDQYCINPYFINSMFAKRKTCQLLAIVITGLFLHISLFSSLARMSQPVYLQSMGIEKLLLLRASSCVEALIIGVDGR